MVHLNNACACCESEQYVIDCIVHSIMKFAIINSDVLHIDITYIACTNEFSVKVFDSKTDYFRAFSRKFSFSLYLDNQNALSLLKVLEVKLIDLVTEAKLDK